MMIEGANAGQPGALPGTGAGAVADVEVDVLVVGGGINGAGTARDLAGRGFSVLLVERDDLASHTSSASTKLIHGGLRYLEHGEFRLVRKALQEREVLLRAAPHLMGPLRFVMPHEPSMRPAWQVRLGLFLYDHLARREVLPGSRGLDLRRDPAGALLQARHARGFEYADGWVDDARLVLANALDARARGATVLTRTACVQARRQAGHWQVRLQPAHGPAREVRARALVNAAGPWADRFLREHTRDAAGQPLPARPLRLVQGSHIVVPRLPGHEAAYLFQNPDGRVLFAIPWVEDSTMIGTTDVEVQGDPGACAITPAEIAYLCTEASRHLREPVCPGQILHTWSGVRPLLDDEHGNPAAVTRDYRLELDRQGPPLLKLWGGKLTTYRRLAEEAADLLAPALAGPGRPPAGPAWTAGAHLPGGDLSAWIGAAQRPDLDFARFVQAVRQRWPWLPPALARRLAHTHGSSIDRVLGQARSMADLGEPLAPGLYQAELQVFVQHEWATTPEDVLWRRTRCGLRADAAAAARVDLALQSLGAGAPSAQGATEPVPAM